MSGAVVSIAQQKGGAGKTTLAIQLGVAWLAIGKRVAMLDIDPQASLFTWFNLRRKRLGDARAGSWCRACRAGGSAASSVACGASSSWC